MDIKSIGKYCTKAKKSWTNNKKTALKTNAMNEIERAKVGTDEVLAKMVAEKEDLDKQIVDRVDYIIALERPTGENDLDVKLILEKVLHTFEALDGLYASDKEGCSEPFKIDNIDLIVQLRKLVEIN